MAKNVKYAKLHQGIFVADVGSIGDTLPPTSKTFPDWKMTKCEDGINCQARRAPGAPLVEFWVPSANIAILTYAPESTPSETKAPPTDLPEPRVVKVPKPPVDTAADTAAFEAAVKAEKHS